VDGDACLLALAVVALRRLGAAGGAADFLRAVEPIFAALGAGGHRALCKAAFAVEGGVNGGANEGHARKSGQHSAQKPAQRDASPLKGRMFGAIRLDRGCQPEVWGLGAPVPTAGECETARRHTS
jgi:hypothetical protein